MKIGSFFAFVFNNYRIKECWFKQGLYPQLFSCFIVSARQKSCSIIQVFFSCMLIKYSYINTYMMQLNKVDKGRSNINLTSHISNYLKHVIKCNSHDSRCESRPALALNTRTLTSSPVFVQGGLVNNIERRVLEAHEYVGKAAESIPKCKKFKKTSRRVRCKMRTFWHTDSLFLSFPPSFLSASSSSSHSPITPTPLIPSFISTPPPLPPASTSGRLVLPLVIMSSTPPL